MAALLERMIFNRKRWTNFLKIKKNVEIKKRKWYISLNKKKSWKGNLCIVINGKPAWVSFFRIYG